MEPEADPLIALLAQTDVLFEPLRGDWNAAHAAEVCRHRDRYQKWGFRLEKVGGNEADRKQHERRLDRLEQTGLVLFIRHNGRRTHWRLTDPTDWKLRSLATWTDWPEMMTMMLAIREQQDAGYSNAGCVPEWSLACGTLRRDKLSEKNKSRITLEELAAPALCRGLMTSWSDCYGAVGYRLTDEGRSYLDADPAPPDLQTVQYDPQANDLYLEHLHMAREARKTLGGEKSHCAVPLSAGDWPEDSEAAKLPPLVAANGVICNLQRMTAAIKKVRRPKRRSKGAR